MFIPFILRAMLRNRSDRPMRVGLGFVLRDAAGRAIDFAGSSLLLQADHALAARLAGSLDPDCLPPLGDGVFHVVDPARGVVGVAFGPHEAMPLTLRFTPPFGVPGFVLETIRCDDDGMERRRLGVEDRFPIGVDALEHV